MPRRNRSSPATSEAEDLHSTPRSEQAEEPARLVEAETLVEALRALGLGSVQRKELFKAPAYSGEGDVELFIKQFNDVAVANDWSEGQQTLHLRTQLQGSAQNCGRGESKAEIVEDLRARYGLSCRQAKDRLSALKRGARQTLHELCAEIDRLVELGFPTLPKMDQDNLIVDYFLRAVDNRALQRHMLAIKPGTPREAVRAAEEFFSVCGQEKASARAMPVDIDSGEVNNASGHQVPGSMVGFAEMMQKQMALLTKLLESLEDGRPSRQATSSGQLSCFECGGPHYKRNCPRLVAQQGNGKATGRGTYQPNQRPQQGNGKGPAQV